MKKSEFNKRFREYVRQNLSPTSEEQSFISKVYSSIEDVLGTKNILQIGSFPRYTAIRPLHDLDLDILWILGEWDPEQHTPQDALEALMLKIDNEYENPTRYQIEVTPQTHSIAIAFLEDDGDKVFAVDIVPAYTANKNDFGDGMYMVPELIIKIRKMRQEYYRNLEKSDGQMSWILTDPRGYIKVAEILNEKNLDFRKSVKFIKAWKNSLKEKDKNLKLKSFHLEQVLAHYFLKDAHLTIFDAVFKFFCNLPHIIEKPQISDRADENKKIDQYLDDLTEHQKKKVVQAKDCFLMRLEEFGKDSSVSQLLDACFYSRHDPVEKFLFDYEIPVLVDEKIDFVMDGLVKRKDGFREYKYKISYGFGAIDTNNKIKFKIEDNTNEAELYKWKVKNDNKCEEPRGEINDHRTKNYPESTKYKGNHYVECFVVKDGVCIARAKQDVNIIQAPKY